MGTMCERYGVVAAAAVVMVAFALSRASAGVPCDTVAARLLATGLRNGEAFGMLQVITSQAGHRLSGSEGAARAVELTRRMMEERGFANVHLEEITVPRWVRGPVESAVIVNPAGVVMESLTVCALGGSIGTDEAGIEAEIIEVRSFEELHERSAEAKGKIVFFNRAFDAAKLNTFEAYGGAVDQRGSGAVEAAKAGAVGALVRSMTLALDDVPHTGSMGYQDGIGKVPAAAISTIDANHLSHLLQQNKPVRVRMILSCATLDDVASANVIGEITGSVYPKEVIVVGGHLDSWDKGTGAHDDGGGCVQAIEVVNLIRKLGLNPKRTIRAVMFMNEENGLRGGSAYAVAKEREGERHVAAIESDAGSFAPRGISIDADSAIIARVQTWKPLFESLNAGIIKKGYSGVDISPLVRSGVPGFGLSVETHRYFDYHHSDNDTIDKVNPRELELGAIVEALLCYLISEEGLQ